MDPELTKYYNRPLPRYTSYPTAPHFTAEIGEQRYRRWLGGIDAATPVSLYLHIPFCQELCWFCGCNTRVVRDATIIAQYRDRLIREIDLVADAIPGRLTVNQIHFGGGSPNTLEAASFAGLLDHLRQRFEVSRDAEVAIEIDPRSVTRDFIVTCAEAGVTRASLGVQDLNPTVQQAINRIQPYNVVARVADELRAAGIADVNVDLMYGLPHQTVTVLLATVEKILRFAPSRIALFGYAHVPWLKPHQKLIDEDALPDNIERWRQFEATAERLASLGYAPVGMDHFARPDTRLAQAGATDALHRNFQGYTTDDAPALLGLGASSIGMLTEGYVQNTPDVRQWAAAVDAGALPTARGIALDDDDRLRRAVIERLMCDLTVDLDETARRFGNDADYFAKEIGTLVPLQNDGVVSIEGPVIRVAPRNRLLIRTVAAAFDRYAMKSAAATPRHSTAV
ncbi:MAG: oxygen-independent coproporphyrinogen III oxidase [Alphaproteobacteria bacterium]|nr:oxygen-independent coproporphyrinogen III oxidase [Alphaproteobacteria bacterium]